MTRLLARTFLRLTGWAPEGPQPGQGKFVLVAAPHTSNWDLPFLLALARVLDVKISWMGKHQLFRGPLGWLMRALGGIPVRRDRSNKLVDQMAAEFDRRESMVLVVPVEGTRGYVPHWKSGFYHIARLANVPILLGYLDYSRRRGGFGGVLNPSGDVRRDMDEIREFYADKVGKYPDCFGAVRLKEES